MDELEIGPPVEKTWVIWHAMIGIGAGLLFLPPPAPPIFFIISFLITAMVILAGARKRNRNVTMLGLMGLAAVEVARAAVIWRAESLGAGSQFVATFLWCMLAIGTGMEAYAVKNRGIS